MKAEELRVNSYYEGGFEIVGSMAAKLNLSDRDRVFKLTLEHLLVLSIKPEWLNTIKPIKLTEQWMRDFGMDTLDFEVGYIEWGFENDNGITFALTQTELDKPFFFEYDLGLGQQGIRIDFVHQLQNLFYNIKGINLSTPATN